MPSPVFLALTIPKYYYNLKNFILELHSMPKKGQMVAMFAFLKLRWILIQQAVSVLNWKNVSRPKSEDNSCQANFVFCQLRVADFSLS